MGETTTFMAEPRSLASKGANRAIRAQGQIPGVIYGGKEPPELITLGAKQISKEHNSGKMLSRVCFIEVSGKKTRVVARDIQVDPVKDRPIHVDFLRLPKGAKVALQIPVQFINAEGSPGLKRGGVINIVPP